MKKLKGIMAVVLLICLAMVQTAPAAITAPVSGEIERITIANINDPWSEGTIVVGGEIVAVPRNLLLDLPANRLTLQQLFAQAPAACVAVGETGLAKADTCNTSGAGGFATISVNRVSGNIIAGDVLIEKGRELVSGRVSYINYDDGYFRLNGDGLDATTGVMVRLNDPTARHTIQQGLGCVTGFPAEGNCSPDPRFTLDPDNYTNVFTTGYPVCIPSTVARRFRDVLDLDGDGDTTERLNARSGISGGNDELCPSTNRSASVVEPPVADSRRFAPIKRGDVITAEGNFETVNGVRFLSAHTTMDLKALRTKDAADQPDYLFLDEVEVDAPAFQNQRARTLIIGYATKPDPVTNGADILIWSLHRGTDNAVHEVPLATTTGCDRAAGAGTCTNQGLVGAGNLIFKIRHDVDFAAGADPKLDPCAHMRADARFNADRTTFNLCATASIADMLKVLSPIPHEIQARTGHRFAHPDLITLDVKGDQATNGQYLFPFGVNLGGISFPEMNEINLNALATANAFSGIPWLMDRRLSPGGCIDTSVPPDGIVDCEATEQPLVPFPFEQYDPRTQVPNFPAGAENRMFTFYPFGANDNFVATGSWPPAIQPHIPVLPTPALNIICGPAPAL